MIETRFLLSKLVKFSPKKIRGQEGGTSLSNFLVVFFNEKGIYELYIIHQYTIYKRYSTYKLVFSIKRGLLTLRN